MSRDMILLAATPQTRVCKARMLIPPILKEEMPGLNVWAPQRTVRGEVASPGEVTPKQKSFETSLRNTRVSKSLATTWSSIAFRFGGLSNFRSIILPIAGTISAAEARALFANLQNITALANRNPALAQREIELVTNPSMPIWGLLLGTACGNSRAALLALDAIESRRFEYDQHALIDCTIEVSRIRPLEGVYLLRQIFARADTAGRLRIIEAFVENAPTDFSCSLIGDLFVQVMARSTPAERHEEIYPALNRMIEAKSSSPSPGRGFLRALFTGWLSESPKQPFKST